MRCANCAYVLTYSDRLLCRVANSHYCPCCWSRIESEVIPVSVTTPMETSDGTNAARGNGEAASTADLEDEEAHVRRLAAG